MKDNRSLIFRKIFVSLAIILVYIPVVFVIIFSFNSKKSLKELSGFSVKWYQELFLRPNLTQAVIYTIIIAVISTIISTIIGTLAAISIANFSKKRKDAIFFFNNIPIISPDIIFGLSLFFFFTAFKIPLGFFSILLAHIAFSVPFVLAAVYPKILTLDKNILDAAYDLGCGYFTAIFKILVPQIKEGIQAGAVIAFTMSFDDFIISYFVSGSSNIQNISIYLYTLKRGLNPSINALSTLIILVIMVKVVYDYATALIKVRKERKEITHNV